MSEKNRWRAFLSDWTNPASTLSSVAVVVGLPFLWIQINDNSSAVRASAASSANEALQSWYRDIGTDPETSELWYRAMTSSEPLENHEEFQFLMLTHAGFLAFQNSYFLEREGTIDKVTLEAITAAVRAIQDLPGMERYWPQRKSYLHSGFVEYVEGLIGQPGSNKDDIYHRQNLDVPVGVE